MIPSATRKADIAKAQLISAVDDLKRRIGHARGLTSSAVRPKPAPPSAPVPRTTHDRKPLPLANRLYNLPVAGYGLRIISAAFNMPKILANLSAHYRTHNTEVGELRALIGELRLQLDYSQAKLDKTMARLSVLEGRTPDIDAASVRRDA